MELLTAINQDTLLCKPLLLMDINTQLEQTRQNQIKTLMKNKFISCPSSLKRRNGIIDHYQHMIFMSTVRVQARIASKYRH